VFSTSKVNCQRKKTKTAIGSNCVTFMFDEIRYELNVAEIDCNRNVGITSTLKSYASFSSDNTMMHNAGLPSEYNAKSLMTSDGYFNFCRSACCWTFTKITNI